jgi:GAF domain-containing protein
MAPPLRSCLAVPLMDGESLVAVLALYRMQRVAFSDDDVRLVELLAPRLATSLAMASLAERNADQPSRAPALTLVKRATS